MEAPRLTAHRPQLHDLTKHDLIGTADFVLGELLTTPGQSLKRGLLHQSVAARGRNLQENLGRGVVVVHAEPLSSEDGIVDLRLVANHLDNKDTFGKSDPYVIIKRSRGDSGVFVEVYKSEVIRNNLDPQWRPIRMSSRTLCNGDLDRPVRCLAARCPSRGPMH